MMKRTLLILTICCCLFACDKQNEQAAPSAETEVESMVLSEESDLAPELLTLDTHIDIPTSLGFGDANPSLRSFMQVDIPSMKKGKLDAGFFIVYVGQGRVDQKGYDLAYEESEKKFLAIERMLEQNPDDIVLARTPKELMHAVSNGKLAAAIGVENAFPLGPKFEHLQEFYDRGARYVSLTHFGNNHFGDSSVAKGDQDGVTEPVNNGLSELGLSLIDSLNTLGIMVDVSHTSKQSTLDAVAHSKAPVIASHSGVKALHDHPRNLSDEEIKAIAAKEGVVQLVAFDAYLRPVTKDEREAVSEIAKTLGLGKDWYKTATQEQVDQFRRARAELSTRFPRTTVARFVDYIDYVVKLVGVDHAGIASDFGGGGGVQGWDYVSETPAVTEELLARGYSLVDIEKIWSGNLLRVWQAVEDYSKKSAE